MVLQSYSTAKQFLIHLLDQLSINPEQGHANIQKSDLEAEISRQAQASRLPIVRAARYVVLQILAPQILQSSTMVAQDVAEAMVGRREVNVGLVMVAVVVGMMVAVAVALLLADHGVARTLSCKLHSSSI